jgi:hypothetical protein
MKKVLLFAAAGALVGLVAHFDTKDNPQDESKPSFLDRVVANLEKLPPVVAVVMEHFNSLNDEQAGNEHDAAAAGHDGAQDAAKASDSAATPA